MGFEKRGNGLYLYRKERRGKRVVSVYYGKGEAALLLDRYERLKKDETRFEKEQKTRSLEAEKKPFEEADQVIDAFGDEVKALENATFLVNGFRKHSRTWRRKRNDKDKDQDEA